MTKLDSSASKDTKNQSSKSQIAVLEMRLHIVEALLTACKNSEMVKGLIKKQDSKERLIEAFSFSKDQAQAIIDLKVPIEQIEQGKITTEIERLEGEIESLKKYS